MIEGYNFGETDKSLPVATDLVTSKLLTQIGEFKKQVKIQEDLNFPCGDPRRKLEGKGIALELAEIWEAKGM